MAIRRRTAAHPNYPFEQQNPKPSLKTAGRKVNTVFSKSIHYKTRLPQAIEPDLIPELYTFFVAQFMQKNDQQTPSCKKDFDLCREDEIPEPLHEDPLFSSYTCVINMSPARWPVLDPTTTGEAKHYYESTAIQGWTVNNPHSPFTKQAWSHNTIQTDTDAVDKIEAHLKRYQQALWQHHLKENAASFWKSAIPKLMTRQSSSSGFPPIELDPFCRDRRREIRTDSRPCPIQRFDRRLPNCDNLSLLTRVCLGCLYGLNQLKEAF